MGKAERKKKAKPMRSHPIIDESVSMNSEEENDTLKLQNFLANGETLPVIKQLYSPDVKERAWAASCSSNLILGDKKIRRLLLSQNLIKALIERLTDDYEIAREALGTLRNLTVVNEHEICVEMYRKDILTPLMVLVSKASGVIDNIIKGIPAESDPIVDARDTIWKSAENIICIIWALSETSQEVLRGINNTNIIPFLMSCLIQTCTVPTNTVVSAAQCLHTLTDDNPDVHIHFQQNPQYAQSLLNVINLDENTLSSKEHLLFIKVLCCGILSNLYSVVGLPISKSESMLDLNNYLMPVLIPCLTFDIKKAADEAIENVSEIDNAQCPETTKEHPKYTIPTAENNLNKINVQLMTLQLALEILSKIFLDCFSKDGDDDGWQDESQEDNDMMSTNVKEDNIMEDIIIMGMNQPDEQSKIHPILNTFATIILPKLFTLAYPTHLSFPEQLGPNVLPMPSVAPEITSSLATVHIRTIECINNFLLVMVDNVEDKWWFTQHREDAKQAWTLLFELGNQVTGKGINDPGQENRVKILDALIGCLWTLARGLESCVPVTSDQIRCLFGCYESDVYDTMRVKIIGTLGMIARRQNAIDDNKLIGSFLFNIPSLLKNDKNDSTSPECVIEVLNAIYDIYADKDFDYDEPVFVQGGYLPLLENIVDAIRKMAKSIDKRTSRDLRLRADEAYENLVAFINYKRDERNN
ncbi:ARM repeat-containing protein [Gigaspora margarita]|uniref:ARM repeat-containing protein n=2 Tax=Gigaspora margarita TaxID=4874 RepID=A0A8H4A883_GIGMA|nr:ARM repeat-containing protein [Gigaspora margarita]